MNRKMLNYLKLNIRKLLANKKRRILLFSAVLLIGTAVAAVSLAYRSGIRSDKETFLKIIPDNVDLQIKNFHFTEVGDENWKWEVNAETAQYVKMDNLAHFNKVIMRIIRKDGKAITITGDKGWLHTDTKNATISGNVLVVTNSGDRITTDKLDYTDAEKTIFTKGGVRFKNASIEIIGKGMTLLIPEEKVSVHEHVRAVYTR